jgi:hypothetical protein
MTERCTATCFGKDIEMTETSREQNHKFLYLTNGIYIAFSIVILASAGTSLDSPELMKLFPFSYNVIVGLICLGTFTMVAGLLGLYGTYSRAKGVLVVWLCMTVALTVSEIVAAALMQVSLSVEEFTKYEDTLFLQNWKDLALDAKTDTDTKEWMQNIQTEGVCCGWLDSTDAEENPAYLSCDASYTITCNEYFRENLSSSFGSLQDVSLALSIVQLLLMISTFALICRLKEFYKSEKIDFGDYTHVPFGKIQNLGDLGL